MVCDSLHKYIDVTLIKIAMRLILKLEAAKAVFEMHYEGRAQSALVPNSYVYFLIIGTYASTNSAELLTFSTMHLANHLGPRFA